jgi:hypothetical protein
MENEAPGYVCVCVWENFPFYSDPRARQGLIIYNIRIFNHRRVDL